MQRGRGREQAEDTDGTEEDTSSAEEDTKNKGENAEEDEPHIIITDESTQYYHLFSLHGRSLHVAIRPPPSGANIYQWLERAMYELHENLCSRARADDFIGVTIASERLVHGPAWISFRRVSDFTPNDLWDKLASITQSADNFEIDDTLLVSCSIASVSVGQGRVPLTHEAVFKRSILTIANNDNLCLPRSLAVAYVFAIRVRFAQVTSKTSGKELGVLKDKTIKKNVLKVLCAQHV